MPSLAETIVSFENRHLPDGFFFGAHPLFTSEMSEIVALVARTRKPAATALRELVEAGLLISYGAGFVAMYRTAADYVAKILGGAAPADLPIEQPAIYELVINLKTAKALGIEVPPTLLARADTVIR